METSKGRKHLGSMRRKREVGFHVHKDSTLNDNRCRTNSRFVLIKCDIKATMKPAHLGSLLVYVDRLNDKDIGYKRERIPCSQR